MDLDKIVSCARALNITGEDLKTFLAEQTTLWKEKDRVDRDELAREREFQAAEKEKDRELERDKLKVELDATRIKAEQEQNTSILQANQGVKLTIPIFNENHDDMDAYLRRFERVMELQSYHESDWAVHLSVLLKGKALETFVAMSKEDASVYAKVKEALLKRFELTEEGFHQKFHRARIDGGESYPQFLERLRNYLTRWITLSKCDNTFEGLQDLLLREQMLNSVGPEMELFLRERVPETAVRMATLAEQYKDARKGRFGDKKNNFKGSKGQNQHKPDTGQNPPDKSTSSHGSPKKREVTCYRCGEVGHVLRFCPRSDKDQTHKKWGNKQKIGCSVGLEQNRSDRAENITVEEVTVSETPRVYTTVFNGEEVKILRDTGCTSAAIKRSLIPESCILDKVGTYKPIDGVVHTTPLCRVYVETPYFKGVMEAMVFDTPIYDIIIGDLPGARARENPDLTWMSLTILPAENLAVVTRAQKKKDEAGESTQLTTPAIQIQNVSPQEMKEVQKQDSSLDKIRGLVHSGTRKTRNGHVISFGYKNGFLVRKFEPEGGEGPMYTQLVVPGKYRKTVMRLGHETVFAGHLAAAKTLDRIQRQFYWPGVQADVKRYCRSCDIYQRTLPRGKVGRVPLDRDFQEPNIPANFDKTDKRLIVDLWERTNTTIDLLTSGMIHVSAVNTVVDMIRSGRKWVTIKGNAGDGKTTLAYMVLRQLRGNMSTYTIEEPEEYRSLSKFIEKRVIMFDDRFGAFTSDQVLIKRWKDVIQDIHRQSARNATQTQVIFVSRNNVVNEARDYLGHFQDTIFDAENIIDLSLIENQDERYQILNYYLKQSKLKVRSEVKRRVAELTIAHGFPHCAMMYPKLRAKKSDLDIEEFFKGPLKFLDVTTTCLYNENCKDLFELMIKNDGHFNVYSLTDEARRKTLLQVEREQEGSYITVWKDGVCVFAHPSIYESVLSVICEKDPLMCIQHAALSVIRQKLSLTSGDKKKSPTQINVKPVVPVLQALAERFRTEILQGDYSVFSQRFCDNEDFCQELLSVCVTSGDAVSEQGSNGGSNDYDDPYASITVQDLPQQTNTRALKDPDTLAHQIVKHLACTPERGVISHTQLQLESIPETTGSTQSPVYQMTVNVTQQQFGDVSVEADTIRNMTLGGQQHIHQTPDRQKEETQQDFTRDQRDDSTAESREVNQKQNINEPDKEGRTMLWTAVDGEKKHMVHALLDNGADINIPDESGNTLLPYIIQKINIHRELFKDIVRKLGPERTNTKDESGMAVLHYLCGRKKVNIELGRFMVTEGQGDINLPDNIGATPLHWLSGNSSISVDDIKQLTVAGNADINIKDDFGFTPLHYLCSRTLNQKSLVALIKKVHGDVNITDGQGNTPLHYACMADKEGADYLLKNIPGADGNKVNLYGISGRDYLLEKASTSPLFVTPPLNRTSQDLVIRVKSVDEKLIPVLGPSMKLNAQRVHRDLQVKDKHVLTNMEEKGHINSRLQFSDFQGTCGSTISLPPFPSPLASPIYLEASATLGWEKRLGTLLEIGVMQASGNLGTGTCISQLPNSLCISVFDICPRHPDRICFEVVRTHQTGEKSYSRECHPLCYTAPDEGFTFTLDVGLVLDVGRKKIALLDLKRGELFCKAVEFKSQELLPMFYVNPFKNRCATRMTLITGREISVSNEKIKLIQQALFA